VQVTVLTVQKYIIRDIMLTLFNKDGVIE